MMQAALLRFAGASTLSVQTHARGFAQTVGGPYLQSPCQSMKAAGTKELVFASVSLLNTFEGTVE